MIEVDLDKKRMYEVLDHLALLNWISLMSHKVAIGKENVNFDDRDFIELPSGKKVVIKITVKQYLKLTKIENEIDEHHAYTT